MKTESRRIYFLCLIEGKPVGGLRKIYEHVEILNKMGFQAFVLHNKRGFRYDWFESSAPVAYIDSLFDPLVMCDATGAVTAELPSLSKQDILVIPETFAYQILPHASKLQCYSVIFNQNAYLTFIQLSLSSHPFTAENRQADSSPYFSKYLLDTLVVSEENVEYVRYVFPGIKVSRIYLGIDFNLFTFQPEKKKQIAFMPRKCPEESLQVVQLIKSRDLLKEWTFAPIINKNEEEVAQILKESALFMSFSSQEGFGLPPIEALACGCLLVGYHGNAGIEYFKSPFADPIPKGDLIGYVKKVEELALQYEEKMEENRARMDAGLAFVHTHYSKEREIQDLKKIWSDIIKNHDLKLQDIHD